METMLSLFVAFGFIVLAKRVVELYRLPPIQRLQHGLASQQLSDKDALRLFRDVAKSEPDERLVRRAKRLLLTHKPHLAKFIHERV